MRKFLRGRHGGRKVDLAWLSFQPDFSISCGLKDRTYIAPRARERVGIWNAYNRVTVSYVVSSDPGALLPVENPHFTYHPAALFHLKANRDRKSRDEEIFEGIADVGIALMQQSEMPWLRITSRALSLLPAAGKMRADAIETSVLSAEAPAVFADVSAFIEVDFIRPEDAQADIPGRWTVVWGVVAVRIKLKFGAPQIATLGWFHSS